MKKLILFLVLVALIIPTFTHALWVTSNGTRVGVVYKLSYKGLFFKGWEGQLLLGNKDSAFNVDANTWEFSLDRNKKHGEDIDSLVKTLQSAEESGKRVRITYNQEFFVAPWRADTDYFVQKVDILDN